MFTRTKGSGAEVIKKKGGAGFAVGLAIDEVIEASPWTVAASCPFRRAEGLLRIRDVALSVPTVVGRAGVIETTQKSSCGRRK